MSLDIAILDKDGVPSTQVSIGVDDHYRLVKLVGESGGILRRLDDYYSDAEFLHWEVGDLVAEVRNLLSRCGHDEQLRSFLRKLAALGDTAKARGKSLVAIAD